MRLNSAIALRPLLRSPLYTGIALLTITLGVAVNTSAFSVLHALVLRPWPFPEPAEVVSVKAHLTGRIETEFSAPEIRELREFTGAIASLTALTARTVTGGEPGRPPQKLVEMLTSEQLFATLGLQPVLGRPYTVADTLPGSGRVALLSYAYWQREFGGRPDVLGRTLIVEGETLTIIGVVPTEFEHLPLWGQATGGMDLWRPVVLTPDQATERTVRWLHLIGRLKRGTGPAQAVLELKGLAQRQAATFSDEYASLRYEVNRLPRTLLDPASTNVSWMLFALSGFVLLIACTNVANLQLARLAEARRELAIQSALGASPAHLLALQAGQALVLAVGGGLLGCGGAVMLNRLIAQRIDDYTGQAIALDYTVLAVTAAALALTAVILTALPAWFVTRQDVNVALKVGARGAAGGGHHRMQQGLIVAEVAFALVLLAGAAMMERGLYSFLRHEAGWDTGDVLLATLPIPPRKYDNPQKLLGYFREVETRLKEIPAAEAVAIATSVPVPTYTSLRAVFDEARAGQPADRHLQAFHVMVTPEYFAALRISVRDGVTFAPDLKRGDAPQVVINESLARALWPHERAVGRRLASREGSDTNWRTVIGVVSDVNSATDFGEAASRYQVYKPMVEEPWPWGYAVVRARSAGRVAATVREVLVSIDPEVPIAGVVPVVEQVRQAHQNVRLVSDILVGFSLLGLGLAAAGIYALVSGSVLQRQREFAIRLALGASGRAVLGLVLRQSLALVLVGAVLGLGGAIALARLIHGQLPRLAGLEPTTFAVAVAVLLVTAAVAAWVPARRAARTDPMDAMRAE